MESLVYQDCLETWVHLVNQEYLDFQVDVVKGDLQEYLVYREYVV
jgi:hypothetical protein